MAPVRPEKLADQVAATVRAEMARYRMTQQDMAEVLGMTQSAVSKRLLGKIPFKLAELEKIAAALGVHPATFFGGGPNAPQPTDPNTRRSPNNYDAKRNAQPLFTVGTHETPTTRRVAA